MSVDLSVILIHYNMLDLLDKCLGSIFKYSTRASTEVILVNKVFNSKEEESVIEKYPRVIVCHTKGRFGIAPMRNMGIEKARGRYIMHLDIDSLIRPDTFDEMVNFMDSRHDAGCCGGKLVGPDGELQYYCRTFFTLPIILFRRTFLGNLFPNSRILRRHLMSDWDHNSIREVDWVGGGFLVMRGELLKKIGALDSRFIWGLEDVDWCYRVWQADWKVYFNPDSVITHYGSRPDARGINRLTIEHLKSGIYFYLKHHLKIFSKDTKA